MDFGILLIVAAACGLAYSLGESVMFHVEHRAQRKEVRRRLERERLRAMRDLDIYERRQQEYSR